MKSSDWWANENECRDSEGNLVRSSPKDGELGPGEIGTCPACESMAESEADRDILREGLRDDAAVEGTVGGRKGACWRIRRSPEGPSPWSCSVMTGDLV